MRKGIFLLVVFLGILNTSKALNNEKRTLEIKRTSESIKIDGILNDKAWGSATAAKDFYQYEPYNGIKPSLPSEVKILYDDQAIYFGAVLYDTSPDSIIKDLGVRDEFSDMNSDLFSIFISTFNDGVNAVEFMVSASGVQSDGKHNGNHGDSNWDGVWESEVKITEIGWIVEIKIPYSALRFSKNEDQIWGIHFFRHIRRYREWSTWNYVDNTVEGFVNQMGEVTGIKDIEPPLRLSVTPYVSAYLENDADENKWNNDFNAGMDLKWGINQSFTLDMILIPDFGQVQSDDEILNLSPFEVKYDEKRPFFTEGTELFNKANIFYSRRIGSSPKNSDDAEDDLGTNEVIDKNPAETQLINATKISGRTDSGLGVGFLNAMTGDAYAEIRDTITGDKRKFQTQGFTNYNMFVLDQTLKNNSYISLANTNVMYTEEQYTANVTGSELKLMNKENSLELFAYGAVSQAYTDDNDFGHKYFLKFSKIRGNFLFEIEHITESDTYDPNDMGFIRNNNESSWEAEFAYNIKEPFWKVLNWNNEISIRYQSLYKPRKYADFEVNFRTNTTFAKQYVHTGLFAEVKPFDRYDYFEPRVDGYKYSMPKVMIGNWWISTDYRKMFAIDYNIGGWKEFGGDQSGYWTGIGPRVRFSDKWLLTYRLNLNMRFNNYGHVDDYVENNDTIIDFGRRDQRTIENRLNTKYIFNNKISLSLRARHYWSRVEYSDFYRLQDDGTLGDPIDYDTYGEDENYNYNAFTIDLQYLWRFAPGSEMSIVWKNGIFTDDNEIINGFWDNLGNTFESSQINSISLKILYYLDYQYLIKKQIM